ncbi:MULTISPECIES: 4-hydroxythreonine-4-phosphate dehydrogenase PdxA [unclassified Chelatococcus]|uniref:4-hydroxythreonine-4-phosphate dehydrogenase PdxA n=1 Tax=unclassified Chelatococcus TaxID=2638111 RepID=UPI001BCC491A|nr:MULTISPECIES: 4-hydroxythreonine-4-phosphate dehydrogenase PdxA [unclassified Chelatococcus]MBS7699899.1 4-hydroxythreonine-4-phosphate dehydrogenase PdxA [Chelatococcus sp. YT9]MBX3558755.1 4-hydroxythreonine-4-phosphate dehydrogenase PdxA [Chelatococcus sp.]
MTPPVLAVTLGDPAGIGPEIALKAVARLKPRLEGGTLGLVLVGDPGALDRAGQLLSLPLPPVIGEGALDAVTGAAILPTPGPQCAVSWGEVSAIGGEQAYQAVAIATRLAQAGKVAGIVTAPLSKEALHLAGHNYPGHTELLATLTGAKGSVMMLAHGTFRVSHVTTHCALEEVPGRATADRIARVIDLTLATLRRLGIERPRVAVAALNPHAGEGGLFGRHDMDVTEPLVRDYEARGEDVVGPVPGDTVFVKLRGGEYDAVVAMYHDQGHIPVKLLGFSVDPETGRWTALSGVNVTLGLPVIRTSVDHGTAFDIAGKGVADETSLIEAIDYALQLANSTVA